MLSGCSTRKRNEKKRKYEKDERYTNCAEESVKVADLFFKNSGGKKKEEKETLPASQDRRGAS